MFTKAASKTNTGKKEDPKEILKGLPGLTLEFLEGFTDGLEFGAFEEKYHIKWKHGSPWEYPSHEYPMIKTAIRALMAVDEITLEKAKRPKIEMPEAAKQKSMSRERAYQEFLNREKK